MALCSGNSPEKPGFFHTFSALPETALSLFSAAAPPCLVTFAKLHQWNAVRFGPLESAGNNMQDRCQGQTAQRSNSLTCDKS
jgi:hypothetical protein